MRTHPKKHGKTPITQSKIQRSLIFAAVFGLVMLMIGLSQLFAQSTVAFYLNPYYQSASANEDRSLAVSLSNNGQRVDGGSVKITYNPAQLSHVAFNDPATTQVGISNRVSAPGSYSYDFQIYYGSQTLPNLGTLVLKAKSLGSQQAAYIDFDASVTKAYFISNSSRNFYPVAHGRAAILISASQAPPATTTQPPPSSPPATSPPPATPRPPASNTTTNNLPTANTNSVISTQAPIPEEPVEDGHNYVPPFESSESSGSEPISKPRRIAPIAFISIGAIILALAGGAYIYLKYIRDLPIGVGIARSLHRGLFDDSPEPTPDEGIVISPAITSPAKHHPDSEPEPEVKSPPAIITKSKERAMHRRAVEESKKKAARHERSADHPIEQEHKHPATTKPAVPHASHSSHNPEHPNHHESETITVPLHSNAAPTITPAIHSSTVEPATVKQPVRVQPPPPSPPPLLPIMTPPQLPREVKKPVPPAPDPGHHIPDWQTQIKVPGKAVHDEDPPDMFELAHDHPESFGSSQLYEVETKENEDHDKAQK